MAQPTRQIRPQFSQPVRQITLMLIVLALTGFGAFVALPRVLPVFQANPYFNGFILFVFFIGVVACFYQVFQLIGSVRWIETFAADRPGSAATPPPLLAPLASMLRSRGARSEVSATSTRSILDSVATRIDEAREITRYIVNMLIFLGLLGTFYGLATTVPAVVDTIRSLSPQEGEGGVDVFNRLMTGLEAQLGGMGVAFASSLLGLAGSLVVGLLELFAGHGQNRFYKELEDWLSSITRVGFSAGDDASPEHGMLASALDHMSEQMDAIQRLLAMSEKRGAQVEEQMARLARALEGVESSKEATEALARIADGQERVVAALESHDADGIDAESRMRLRSIDVQMLRILEEISAGRQETMAELRRDLAELTRVLAGTRRNPSLLRPNRPGGGER